jgi:hypothetical protein
VIRRIAGRDLESLGFSSATLRASQYLAPDYRARLPGTSCGGKSWRGLVCRPVSWTHA